MTSKKFFQSRKFIVFVVSVILYVVNSILHHNKLPCVPEQYMPKLIMLVIAWLGAQGIADINATDNEEEIVKEITEATDIAKDVSNELLEEKEKEDKTLI